MNAFTYDAPKNVRCTAERGALRCSLAYDHEHGHVYVSSGSHVASAPRDDDLASTVRGVGQ